MSSIQELKLHQQDSASRVRHFLYRMIVAMSWPERKYLETQSLQILYGGSPHGHGVDLLSTLFPRAQIVGYGTDYGAVSQARALYSGNGFFQGDAFQLPGMFDVIIHACPAALSAEARPVIRQQLRSCRMLYIVQSSFQPEKPRSEYQTQTEPASFPEVLDDFVRLDASPFDVDVTYQPGQGLLLIYASREYLLWVWETHKHLLKPEDRLGLDTMRGFIDSVSPSGQGERKNALALETGFLSTAYRVLRGSLAPRRSHLPGPDGSGLYPEAIATRADVQRAISEVEIARREAVIEVLAEKADALETQIAALREAKTPEIRPSPRPFKRLLDRRPRIRRSFLLRQYQRFVPAPVRARLARRSTLSMHPPAVTPALPPGRKVDVICFAVIPWDFRFQRPQQLMTRFARAGHRVFYIHTQFANTDKVIVRSRSDNLYDVHLPGDPGVNMYRDALNEAAIVRPYESLVDFIAEQNLAPGIVVVHHPFWEPLAQRLKAKHAWKLVYDCMDDHSGFEENTPHALHGEARLVEASDLLIVSSSELLKAFAAGHPNSILVRNAADFEHFSQLPPRGTSPIADLPRPVIGYYGAIAEWFDVASVAEAARRHPQWSFALIGHTRGADVTALEALPNVHLLGEQPYDLLPAYLAAMDVCTIPFRRIPLTEATDPVKVYEYLSAGKPIVARRLPELERLSEWVKLYDDVESFNMLLEAAVEDRSVADRKFRRERARIETWEMRYRTIEAALKTLFPRISIIIVTYKNPDYLRLSLISILERTLYPNYEVIVVDNGGDEDTVALLREMHSQHPHIRFILNDTNLGFSAANNLGIDAAVGSAYIVLLNDDVVVTNGWLVRLIAHLADDSIGMVGPVTNRIGNEAQIAVDYEALSNLENFAFRYTREHRGQSFDIHTLAMYCAAIRREIIDQIGPLDERFTVGMFEDDDYSRRVQARGYRTICAEDAFVHHFGRTSFSRLSDTDYQRIFAENRAKYEAKWGQSWEPHKSRPADLPLSRSGDLSRQDILQAIAAFAGPQRTRPSLAAIADAIREHILILKEPELLRFYDTLFARWRDQPINILEVGLYEGGSLLMLAQYFPKARILGIDIQPPNDVVVHELDRLLMRDRVSIELGLQDNIAFLDRVIDQHFGGNGIDIIIDDASHFYKETRASFSHLFKRHLNSGGLYIIEDWGAGYYPKWADGNPDGVHGLPKLVKELVDEVAWKYRTATFHGDQALTASDTEVGLVQHLQVMRDVIIVTRT